MPINSRPSQMIGHMGESTVADGFFNVSPSVDVRSLGSIATGSAVAKSSFVAHRRYHLACSLVALLIECQGTLESMKQLEKIIHPRSPAWLLTQIFNSI